MKRTAMKALFVLNLFIISTIEGYAQAPVFDPNTLNAQFKNVIPPTPNAAALGKFGDIPVGYSTGVPSITIPIFSWTSNRKDIGIDISLNYHAGGYKAEEMASNIGLGWALNAGGVISRNMRGLPDDYPVYGFLNSDTLPPVSDYDFNGSYVTNFLLTSNTCGGNFDICPEDDPNSYCPTIASLNKNQLDPQQDIFNYSFNGRSGRFVINKQGNVQKLDDNKLSILLVKETISGGHAITGFIITDERGITYTFAAGDVNSVTSYSNTVSFGTSTAAFPAVLNGYTVTWNLIEIASPFNEEKIEFTYEWENRYTTIDYENGFSESSVICDGAYRFNGPPEPGDREIKHTYSYNANNISTQTRLGEIKLPDSTVIDFDYKFPRADLANDSALTEIIIRNGAVLKGDTLTYDYFNTSGGGSDFESISTNDYSKKLKLTSVTPFGGDLSIPPYSITYNGIAIPPVASTHVDYWGYFNGSKSSGFTLIPAVNVITDGFASNVISLLSGGSDRSSDSANAQAGLIQKITYPTGGYTQFEFETNDCTSDMTFYHKHFTSSALFSSSLPNTFQELTMDQRATTGVTFSISLTPRDSATGFPGWENSCPISFVVYNDDETYSQTISSGEYANYLRQTKTTNVDIPLNDEYKIKMVYDPSSSCAGAPDFFVGAAYQYDLIIKGQLAGGVRIKTLKDVDPVTGQTTIRKFQYVNADSTSSGVINVVPNFDYFKTDEYRASSLSCQSTPCFINLVNRVSNSNVLLGSYGGSNVVYKRVIEKRVDSNDRSLGATIYEFTPFDGIGFLSTYPYPPGQLFDWKIGLPTKTSIYDSSGTLMKTIQDGYQFFIDEIKDQYNRSFKVGLVSNQDETETKNLYVADDFYPYVGRAQKSSTITRDFSGTHVVEDSVHYDYDSTYFVLKESDFIDSRGVGKKVLNYYSQDYSGISVIGALLSQNMIALPIATEYWQTKAGVDQLINGRISDYQLFGPTPRVKNSYLFRSAAPVPEGIIGHFDPTLLIRDTTLFQKEASINSYDSRGNFVSVIEHDGINQVFVWDYFGQKLVAHVANANLNDVAYTSFEADGSGNWTIFSPSFDTTDAITGSRSLIASNNISKIRLTSSTTYVVSYWTTNSSPFTIAGTISGYPVKGKTIGNWTLYTHRVTGDTIINVSGSGHIDELRLYPLGAQMTTYSYTPLIGMTAQCDIGNRITYYEYDGLARLIRIRDQDKNIIKTLDYQYQVASGCGDNCYVSQMQTLAGTSTISYPVGVFNVHGKLLGNATNQAGYISLWNADTADTHVATISAGADSLHFQVAVVSGKTLPAITGCRYYQYDLPWSQLDGVRNLNGVYVDFGDSTGMYLAKNLADTPSVLAANTTYKALVSTNFYNGISSSNYSQLYLIHTYPDTSLKTITFYHNDATENSTLDNANSPANSLIRVRNLRGNLPANTDWIGGSAYQFSSASSVANIANWSQISSIKHLWLNRGDGIHGMSNIGYVQDFLKSDKGLQEIETGSIADTSFKLSRLRSDWNTYYTNLQILGINDLNWSREDLTALTNLWFFDFTSNKSADSSVIDHVIMQMAAGSAQNVRYGVFNITWPGCDRTSVSNAAVAFVKSRGWQVFINGRFE